ncbi:hypothetical protein Tco_1534043 [Tanacetum coccineum]
MAPKRTTRSTPATTTTTTTPMTDALLKVLIDQGVADTLVARDTNRSQNGEDSHDSRTSVRRQSLLAREIIGHDVAYAMTWTNLKRKLPISTAQGARLRSLRMFPEESDKIEKYVGGLSKIIHESVKASKTRTMQDAIEFATKLIDKKISTFAERKADNNIKFDDTSKNNQNHQ